MKFVDLFCGAGGASQGIRNAGGTCAGAVDADADALIVYSRNHPDHPAHRLDLTVPLPEALACEWREALACGLLWASSPCQGFSAARHPNAASAVDSVHLTVDLAAHLRRLLPMWFVFENVRPVAKSVEFQGLCDALVSLRYSMRYGIVHTQNLGMTQSRKRLILIAGREATDSVVQDIWEQVHRRRGESPPTMRECFASTGIDCGDIDHIYIPACDAKGRRSVYSLDDTKAPTVRGMVRPFRETYVFTPRDSCHDRTRIKAITCEHNAVLQGFPPSFAWPVPQTKRARFIGNAVPPPLAQAIVPAIDHVQYTSVIAGTSMDQHVCPLQG